MAEQRPVTIATLAPVVFSLILGGIIGIEIHKYSMMDQPHNSSPGGAPGSGGRSGGGGAGGGGGGMMAGGMGGGGGQPNSGRTLARLVGSISTIEKLQGKGLTKEQDAKLQPILVAIESATSLPEADAKAKLDAVNAVLTPDQTQAIADMTPARGGRGGGGGMAPGGPGLMANSGGGPGPGGSGGGPRSGGMGGGAQQDPNKPFSSERSKKSLDDLIAAVKAGVGK